MRGSLRSYVATAVALGIITLTGCATETDADSAPRGPAPGEDWGDENKYPEIGGAYASLTALATAPTFTNGTLQITLAAGGETVVIGKRAVDSAILVNGVATAATATTLKKIDIDGGAGDDVVILDFLGGVFAPGIATARGIDVDLAAGTNSLRIRGTSGSDAFAVGTDGVAFNVDAFRDIDVVWANTTATFALASGNDSFVATAGGKGVAGNAAIVLTVFGGDGNDVLTGGDGNDVLWGGGGNDTIWGGIGDDTIAGEAGADVITQGADDDGDDLIHCGTENPVVPATPVKDTVTYALRGTATGRDETDLTTVLASDPEPIRVTVGGACVDTTPADGTCDPDANGLPQYPADDGIVTESAGTFANGVMTVATTLAIDEKDAVAPDCEIVIGGMDRDILTGDGNANTLLGGDGPDLLTGGLGIDSLSGEAGNDTFDEESAPTGGDIFIGGAGIDTVDYSARTAVLTVTMDGKAADDGGAGETDNVSADIENLKGGTLGDTITGNALNNVLTGGLGADVLFGLAGNDTFDEGAVTNGGDVFNGGDGTDLVNYALRTNAVTVTMDGLAANDGEGESDNVKADVEDCNGGDGVDSITGNASNNNINGGAGADTLLSGLAGDDTLDGEADGAVTVNGGDGSDLCLGATLSTGYVACEI